MIRFLTLLLLASTAFGQGTTPTFRVDSLNDLVQTPIPVVNGKLTALVSGRYSAADGGGDIYYYIAGSSTTTNFGSVVKPASTTGRWFSPDYGRINPKKYGAKGDGTTVDSLAIANAMLAAQTYGGNVYFPGGTFVCNLTLPATPLINIYGAGIDNTILQSAVANTPVLGHAAATVDGRMVCGFTIRAHNSGSTGAAISMIGWRFGTLSNIRLRSALNGTGNFAKGIICDATTYYCHANVLDTIQVINETGPATILSCENDGSSVNNPNNCHIRNWTVLDNATGVTTIISGMRSSAWTVEDSIFENNPLATAIIMGDGMYVNGNWFELNVADFAFQANAGDGSASNGGKIKENYTSTTHAITIGATLHDNVFEDNYPNDTKITLTDLGQNNVIKFSQRNISYSPDAAMEWDNRAAGGKRWAALYNGTGGTFPGAWVLENITDASFPFFVDSTALSVGLRLKSYGARFAGLQEYVAMAAPPVSSSGEGRIFYDVATDKLKASENGSAYVNIVPTGGAIGGTLTPQRVPVASASQTLTDGNVREGGNYHVPITDNTIFNGSSTNRWADVRTVLLNGATPGTVSGTLVAGNIPYADTTSSLAAGPLFREDANTVAQRNGTTAQNFKIYNTDNGANDELGVLGWTGNVLYLGTDRTGTGAQRDLSFVINGSPIITLKATSPHLLWNTDNTYDIGASGANRPRAIYVASNGVFGGGVTAGVSGGLNLLNAGAFTSTANGVWQLSNLAGNDFTRLGFGGSTTNFAGLSFSNPGTGNSTIKATDAAGVNMIGFGSRKLHATKTANYPIVAGDSSTTFDNNGAAGEVDFTLLSASNGSTVADPVYTFVRVTAQVFKIIASGSDTITVGASTSAAGGNITLDTAGAAVTLERITQTGWYATASIGTITVN